MEEPADSPMAEADPRSPAIDEEEQEQRRLQNVKALLDNSLETSRAPLLSKFLRITQSEQVLRRAFRSPAPGAPAVSQALQQKLAARKRFVPWGSNQPFKLVATAVLQPAPVEPVVEEELPPGIEPLVLWEPPDGEGDPVVVDNMLVRWLRPHQREGVQFMFECVAGLRMPEGRGCILADDMGLGKTLQGISLLWTLLQNGHEALGGKPLAKRAIIVCPTSLVNNWDNECTKWLKGRVRTLPLCESSREDVISSVQQFLHPSNPFQCLIISYETFRLHAERFKVAHACDLLICDEAHRLKNDATLTNRALDSLQCKRRVLLSGTPMQNHLDEFYAMVDFCNPGILGTPADFRRHYENPILVGREPGATEEAAALGDERSAELSGIVNQFIMRRTNKLLSDLLPPKVIEVVCCKMTELQKAVYCHYLESKAARRLLQGSKATGVLSAITALKKLCNHPKLIYDSVHSKVEDVVEGFECVESFFPPGLFDNGRAGRGGLAAGWEALGSKMGVVARMLELLHTRTNDRIVIVSNYTQTLDLFGALCRERNYPFVRLDGTTTINKRNKLVKAFNDPQQRQFVFLLSSKAGGCGLNLIGGNRLVLFDPDWNPATDKQAAARVWRDGQRKRVYVYRMLTTGSIEEKVFQRQLSKEGLQQVVDNAAGGGGASSSGGGGGSGSGGAAPGMGSSLLSTEELRELFTLRQDTASDTYDLLCCGGNDSGDGAGPSKPSLPEMVDGQREQVGKPTEEDLKHWGHHTSIHTVPDTIMQEAAGDDVSFVFSCKVDGKEELLMEEEPPRGAAIASTSGRQATAPAGATATKAGVQRFKAPAPANASFRQPIPQRSAPSAAAPSCSGARSVPKVNPSPGSISGPAAAAAACSMDVQNGAHQQDTDNAGTPGASGQQQQQQAPHAAAGPLGNAMHHVNGVAANTGPMDEDPAAASKPAGPPRASSASQQPRSSAGASAVAKPPRSGGAAAAKPKGSRLSIQSQLQQKLKAKNSGSSSVQYPAGDDDDDFM